MRPQRHQPRQRHRANDAQSIRSSRLYYLTKRHTSVHFYPQNAQVFPRETVDNYSPPSCPSSRMTAGFFTKVLCFSEKSLWITLCTNNYI